ncbi:MAG: UDP-N-acetylglucosamine--N-acetylmuramyl-(pentapeptide) pyrophosphoryl-undecaprenol N-acetylglucosamine transferase [Planctomycetes bacterium]|nr:UDP-N-acetylglucosamine--N-acetylmuramyl-(pentapeptide) pyrophosphoryl-undecaprenol N-acetylglucosamine transferase [Planctomycetota bacterium]
MLHRRLPDARFVFFGTARPIDQQIIGNTSHELVPQALRSFCRVPWRWPGFLYSYWQAARLCRARLQESRPLVVIGTGSLSSIPAVREAHRLGIPVALLNPDLLVGRANRHLSRMADVVFAQWEDTAGLLPSSADVRVCGCAIRPEFGNVTRAGGLACFDLDSERKTLLVTGASQGARTVNEAVVANLDFLETAVDWQVLHLTGGLDFERVQTAYQGRSIPARVLSFTHHMAEAIAAADLVVSRAGASTLAEITAVGRASVLMPYPFHKDMHQLANARCLERAAAARVVHDAIDLSLNGPKLREVLTQLMRDPRQLEEMAAAARQVGRRQAATDIADQVMQLATRSRVPSACEILEA